MLDGKTLTELRGIAQSFGVADIFQKDDKQLLQEIAFKQKEMAPKPVIDVPLPSYDARLMTKPPSKQSSQSDAQEAMQPYIAQGLHFAIDFNGERWEMAYGKKTDEGTLRMPLRTLIHCAKRIME